MEFVLFGISFRANNESFRRGGASGRLLSFVFVSCLVPLSPSLFSTLSFFIICHFAGGYRSSLFIVSAAYMHINDESSGRSSDRAEREEYIFDSFRRELRVAGGEREKKKERHLTTVH